MDLRRIRRRCGDPTANPKNL